MNVQPIITIAALLACGGVSPTELQQSGDSATYDVFQGEQNLGSASYEVTRLDGGGREIKGVTKLTIPTGLVTMETSTTLGPGGEVMSYRLFVTLPGGGTQELEIDFKEGVAEALMLIGGSQREQSIELPEEWIILDNNSAPHMALLVATLAPDMEARQGKAFVPQRLLLVDYTLESAGEAHYRIGGRELSCHLYKMNLAGSIDVEFYVREQELLAMEQPGQAIKFVLATE